MNPSNPTPVLVRASRRSSGPDTTPLTPSACACSRRPAGPRRPGPGRHEPGPRDLGVTGGLQSDHGAGPAPGSAAPAAPSARNGVRAANWAAVIIAYIVLFIVVVALGTHVIKDRAEH